MGSVIKAIATHPSVACPYCSRQAKLVDGGQLGFRNFRHRHYWACMPCQAWVNCHAGSSRPLGTPANSALRRARAQAHAVFDLIWQPQGGSRDEIRRRRIKAYRWLAQKLRIKEADCHIGLLTLEQCERVIQVSQQRLMDSRRRTHNVVTE